MSLTCSFRNIADQVKHHLVGGRRRASSSHHCLVDWDFQPHGEEIQFISASCMDKHGVSTLMIPRTTRNNAWRSTEIGSNCECNEKSKCSISLTNIFEVHDRSPKTALKAESELTVPDKTFHNHQKIHDTCCMKHSQDLVDSMCKGTLLESLPGGALCSNIDLRAMSNSICTPAIDDFSSVTDQNSPRMSQKTKSTSTTLILSINLPQYSSETNSRPVATTLVSTNKPRTVSYSNEGSITKLKTRAYSTLPLSPDFSMLEDELRSNSLEGTETCLHNHGLHRPRTRDRGNTKTAWNTNNANEEQYDQHRMTMSYSGSTTLTATAETKHAMTVPQGLHRSPVPQVASCPQPHLVHGCYSHVQSVGRFHPMADSEREWKVGAYDDQRGDTSSAISVSNEHPYYIRSTLSYPSAPVDQQSDEMAPPILPARTTSLASSGPQQRAQGDALLQPRVNGTQRVVNENNKEHLVKSCTSSHSKSKQYSNNSIHHNRSGRRDKVMHIRSRSDVTLSRLRCDVDNSDSISAVTCSRITPQSLSGLAIEGRVGQEANQTIPLELSNLLEFGDRSNVERNSLSRSHLTQQHKVEIVAPNTMPSLSNTKNLSLSTSYDPITSSCVVVEQPMPINHASRLLGRMSDKLRDGRLADVILLAGGARTFAVKQPKLPESAPDRLSESRADEENTVVPMIRIPAHRVILAAASDYFAAMFGNEVKEASETEIWIRNVEPHALQILINYIYTGHLDLQEDTVEDTLKAACFLQILEASEACEKYLIKRLQASNCLGMSRLGDQHGCHLLHRKATKYALEHFTEVAQQPDFFNLTFDELTQLLQSDHLYVPNEATVFAACLRWIRDPIQRANKIPNSRTCKLSQLLRFVRLQQLPERLLTEVLDKEPLFHEDMEATRMLISALKYHFSQNSPSSNPAQLDCSTSEPHSKMTHHGMRIIRQHCASTDLLKNEPSSAHLSKEVNTVEDYTSIPNPREMVVFRQSPRPSTIGRLWALGGKTMVTTRALQEILEYDPYWNSWRTVGQLPGQRQQCGCTVLHDGRLLIVGGRDELKTLSTVECIYTDELIQKAEKTVAKTATNDGTIDRSVNDVPRRQRYRPEGGPQSNDKLNRSTAASSTECRSHNGLAQSNERPVESQSGWNIVSAMATHRHGLGVAVLGGVVYAVGGHDGWSYLNTVERWNGKAKAWSSVTPMAVQRSTVGVTALDGLLYAVGGRDGSACLRTVERFNPHTQHWCFIAPMLHRRGGVGVGAVGGRLYAVGGHNAPPNQPHAMRTSSVEMYDPQTDTWTEVACLSSPRDSIAVTTLGMRLYALGGHDGQVYTDRVQVYDPDRNQWSDVAPLPSGRAGIAVASCATWPAMNDINSRLSHYKADPLA